jgi:hypothetical protein
VAARAAAYRHQDGDIVAPPINLGELVARDVEDAEMDVDGVPREVSRDLAPDDDVRQMGQPPRALDGVVIGDRDEIHAARLGQAVDALRGVVRLADEVRQRPDVRHA